MSDSGKSTRFDYLDFVLEIGTGEGGTYPVGVIQSPAGRTKEEMRFPFDESKLQMHLMGIENSLLRSAASHRLAPNKDEEEIQKFGSVLFDALFTESVQDLFDVSLDRARSQGKGLRIKLYLMAPDLVALPWEFLYDARRGEYLCFSRKTPIIRTSTLPLTIPPLTIEPPLSILGMIASPRNLPQLDVQMEKERLEKSLQDLQKTGLVKLHWLEGQTWRELQRAMRHGPWHVFHFIGHGGFDKSRDEGFLAFCDDQGERDDMSATSLARLLADHSSIRLVVLNACEGARSGQEDVFSSTASILLRHGITAVLAMQYAISDRAAVEFSRTFYEALADGLPVDAAVVEGRLGISLAFDDSLEWGTPVLFSQSVDGNIFDITPKQLEAPEPVSIASKPSAETPKPEREITGSQPDQTQQVATPTLSKFSGVMKLPKTWITAGIIIGIILTLFIGGVVINNALDNEPVIGVLFTKTASPTFTITTEFTPSPTLHASDTPIPSSTPTASQTPTVTITPSSTPLPQMIIDKKRVTMVLIPGGRYQMGLDTELAYKECLRYEPTCNKVRFADGAPVHPVDIDTFYMDEKEVTNAQYSDCVKAGQCPPPQATESSSRSTYYGNLLYADYPVVHVSWEGASSYCEWRGARLPSEAEWEFAARGGLEGRLYPWGNDGPICSIGMKNGAQFRDPKNCNSQDTGPVGQFTPNGYGLYDMAGNVWEWVADWYGIDYYRNSPTMNPSGPPSGIYRVMRGGSWDREGYFSLTTLRATFDPKNHSDQVGFRCVRTP